MSFKRRVVCAGAIALTGSAGQAFGDDAPRICNGTNIEVSVAIAWWGSSPVGLHTKGWFNVQPGQCRDVFPDDSFAAHRYYFAYNQYDPQHPELMRAWSTGPNDGNGWCIGTDRFEFQDQNCSAPNLRRGFLHIDAVEVNDFQYIDPDVTLTWDSARPGNMDW